MDTIMIILLFPEKKSHIIEYFVIAFVSVGLISKNISRKYFLIKFYTLSLKTPCGITEICVKQVGSTPCGITEICVKQVGSTHKRPIKVNYNIYYLYR